MINLTTLERLKEIRHQTSADLSPVLLMSYIEAMASHKLSPGDESQNTEEHINETITVIYVPFHTQARSEKHTC